MRFWPFGRRKPVQPPLIDDRHMNEDWEIGDLAEAIVAFVDITKGTIYRVRDIHLDVETTSPPGFLIHALFFEGKRDGYASDAFRKIRPLHEPATKTVEEMIRDAERMPVRVKADG